VVASNLTRSASFGGAGREISLLRQSVCTSGTSSVLESPGTYSHVQYALGTFGRCYLGILGVLKKVLILGSAAPVSGPQHAPGAGLASVEHVHRERFVTGSAGARGARSQYDFRPKCSYAHASLRQKAALHEVTKRVSNFF
jgi:hypothetical protein